ncbi:MAG: biopolymer transporter ExbD [Ignavibacteria bacterium]|nr:biopolymer transporter ExbD [Ignavibacteria bacterium]
MPQIRKKKTPEAEIPTSSMADIAFLLLLFFLVATTIDVDTGIGLTLPEFVPPEEQIQAEISKDRLATLLINENGDILLSDEVVTLAQIGEKLKVRIRSKIDLPNNKKLIVSVKTDSKTNYNLYIQALDQVKESYFEVREEYSFQKYGRKVINLDEEQSIDVKERIPIIISIAEPEVVK